MNKPAENGTTVSEGGASKGGRPRAEINYDQLRTLCGIRCTGRECAAVLGIRYETLDKRLREDYAEEKQRLGGIEPEGLADGFREFFRIYSIHGKASLRRALWESALKDRNASTLRLLARNVLRMTDNPEGPSPRAGDDTPNDEMREYTREELNAELVARGLPTQLLIDRR